MSTSGQLSALSADPDASRSPGQRSLSVRGWHLLPTIMHLAESRKRVAVSDERVGGFSIIADRYPLPANS